MPLHTFVIVASLLDLNAATAFCQQARTAPGSAPIIQPGAPGQSSKTLSPADVVTTLSPSSEADVKFMQDMIMHHTQAVEMTALLRTRSHNKEVQELGERISISQTDELRFMKQWLEERGKTLPAEHGVMSHMDHMGGMEHMPGMDMGSTPTMPGMLTPQQMETLARATGPEFDHLFLTGMIQHHTGALIMVKQLFQTPAAGQDAQLFDFTTDVDNTQQAEIDIMRSMLKEKQ